MNGGHPLEPPFLPDWASPPGDTIACLLEEACMSQETLAIRTGLTETEMVELLSGRLPITEAIALKLRDSLGGTHTFWMRREENYRAALERLKCHK